VLAEDGEVVAVIKLILFHAAILARKAVRRNLLS
jgi:hypothetical protein